MQRYILVGGIFPKKWRRIWKTFEIGVNFWGKIESLTWGWSVEARLSHGWMMKNYDEKCWIIKVKLSIFRKISDSL